MKAAKVAALSDSFRREDISLFGPHQSTPIVSKRRVMHWVIIIDVDNWKTFRKLLPYRLACRALRLVRRYYPGAYMARFGRF